MLWVVESSVKQRGRKLGSLHSTSPSPAHISQILPPLTLQLSAFIFISLHLCRIYICIYLYVWCTLLLHYYFQQNTQKDKDNNSTSIPSTGDHNRGLHLELLPHRRRHRRRELRQCLRSLWSTTRRVSFGWKCWKVNRVNMSCLAHLVLGNL